MIRNRGTKDRLKIVRQLDAFPKIPEKYKTSSKIGGTRKPRHIPHTLWIWVFNYQKTIIFPVSVLSRALIVYLLYKEIAYYLDSNLIFKFKPDTDMDSKLKIHIDLTVATPCRSNYKYLTTITLETKILKEKFVFYRHRGRYFRFDKSERIFIRCIGRR